MGIFESVPALQDGLEKGLATPSRSPNTQQGLYRCLRSLQSDEAANPQETLWALIVGIDIDERYDEEFNEWYDTEHLPLLATVEGVARARRYILDQEQALLRPGSPPPRYLAIFELDDPHVPQGARWHAHVSTPWCDRIFRFRRLLFRTVYARVPVGR